jgi:quercetin dioxygenase-like cupin family protein
MGTMSKPGLTVKHADNPDERRPFAARGHADVVKLDGGTAMRAVFEPGWRWSQHVKPLAGTASCQASHSGYVLSGRMKIVMDDGTEGEVGPGDFMQVAPGHDAWVVGNEPCVVVDFGGIAQYAQPRAGTAAGTSAPGTATRPTATRK